VNSLYIHWPFCPYRCFYCPFVAIAGQDEFMGQYHEALVSEIKKEAPNYKNNEIQTIYFGGGTPSTYPLQLLVDMFAILKTEFQLSPEVEITIEVNPGTATEEHFALWQQIGINRVSVGVQSFNEKALVDVNRHQSVAQVILLLETIFHYIQNVSVDIILGLPGVSNSDWKEMLQKLVSYPITHISMYILEVHDTTQLFYKLKTGALKLPHEEETIQLFYWTRKFLADHGFFQYELSNFARHNLVSKHNSCYWDRKPFRGFGLGAWSFDGSKRFANEKNLMLYCKKATKKDSLIVEQETISDTQKQIENIMLGMRRANGISYDLVVRGNEAEKEKIQAKVTALLQEGLMEQKDDNRLVLTPKGLILENRIVAELL
jgi:oxygen-independent coproporphyrinogen III oxidase